jgi:phosphate starvation-inducible protein PhoH
VARQTGARRDARAARKQQRANRRRRAAEDGALTVEFGAIQQAPCPKRQGVKPFQALTEAQADYAHAIRTATYTFGIGPAGTGKTYVAVCGRWPSIP